MTTAGTVARVPLDGEGTPVAEGVETFPVGSEPRGIVSSGDSVWVANSESASISEIAHDGTVDTEDLEKADAEPTDIAFLDDTVWVSDRTGFVIRIGGIGQDEIEVGANPKGIVAMAGAIWVANTDDGTVSRIDPESNEVAKTIDVGGVPRGVAAGFGHVWVANGDGWVDAIDPRTNQATQVELSGAPSAEEVAIGPKRVWVTTGQSGTLAAICPDEKSCEEPG